MKSVLCDLIHNNPEWEHICEEKNIRVKHDSLRNYAIFNYEINADFSDPLVQEARGIIIDVLFAKVLCWPFRKFGNFSESYADKIDWSTASVQEKVDGSIIKLWYDPGQDVWVWSTNSCIYASDAIAASGRTFQSLIYDTPEFDLISNLIGNANLEKDFTYIFELVGPENQVILKYSEAHLYHIGTRNRITGNELDVNIGITKPKKYALHSLEECKDAVVKLNTGDFPDAEGFVVCDAYYNRIKIKSPQYLLWHHMVDNGCITKERAFELVYSDDFDFNIFKENVSEYTSKIVEYYITAFTEARKAIAQIVRKARDLQNDGLTRKEIALNIKESQYSYYGFKALNSDLEPDLLIDSFGAGPFLKIISDYTGDVNEAE